MQTTKHHQQKNNSLVKFLSSCFELFFPSKQILTVHIDGVVILESTDLLEVYQKIRSVVPTYYLNRVHTFADFKKIMQVNSEYNIQLPSGSVIGAADVLEN